MTKQVTPSGESQIMFAVRKSSLHLRKSFHYYNTIFVYTYLCTYVATLEQEGSICTNTTGKLEHRCSQVALYVCNLPLQSLLTKEVTFA